MSNQSAELKFSEHVLLVGAGFTKNFGGILAEQMWVEIFNHEKLRNQPRIKRLMLKYLDYETVYYSVLNNLTDKEGLYSPTEFNIEEKKAIIEATETAYERIDSKLRTYHDEPPFRFTNFNRLLYEFGRTKKNSFIFSLNQDLLIERFYQNPEPSNPNKESKLSIPGIKNSPEWFMNTFIYMEKNLRVGRQGSPYCKLKDCEYCQLPTQEEFEQEKNTLLHGENYFLIKLHGSYNWKDSSSGLKAMVIGRGKLKRINEEPLLKEYFLLFKKVLSQKQRRLLVIGYGFGDEHINKVISNAVEINELKIYILSPESPRKFKENLYERCKTEEADNIWKGISNYFQCVEEVLLYGNQPECELFYKSYFGDENIF